jgi:cytidylate kinase
MTEAVTKIITIDGPAGAGKSTVARLLAQALECLYLDSGALYRLVGLQTARLGLDLDDANALGAFLEGLRPEIVSDSRGFRLLLKGEDLSRVIREPWVGQAASRVALLPLVRAWVTGKLHRLAAQRLVVAEGRDLGSVVFRDAAVKLYLNASLAVRAARRRQEWQTEGSSPSSEEVAQELADRDRRDETRAEAPLQVPAGALVIDTTELNPQEVVQQCLDRIREVLPGPGGLAMKIG